MERRKSRQKSELEPTIDLVCYHTLKGLIMELQLFKAIVKLIVQLSKPMPSKNFDYDDVQILKVWFWAVIHDRPMSWAVQLRHWPIHLRRGKLPSDSQMSRRLRTPSIRRIFQALEERIIRPKDSSCLNWFIDGKPLVIGGSSKDRQAGYGRAAGGKAKGYKLHVLLGKNGELAQWRVAPMNKDERVMAERMLKSADIAGYVTGYGNYDSNRLHKICDEKGNLQFVAPRRYGKDAGLGKRPQTAGRLRSKAILEEPFAQFGQGLLAQRDSLERYFGNCTSWGGGLTHLPPWVRTFYRVYRWVQAKLLLCRLKQTAAT